jgi:RNA polymerase sigma-70 factor, ECF subfamily
MTSSPAGPFEGWSPDAQPGHRIEEGLEGHYSARDLSDEALVGEVRAGHRERFSHLVARHQGSLLRQALSMGLDRDTAEDMVQDAFVRAYEKLEGFQQWDRFRIWVGSVLRNRCLDHLKRPWVHRSEPLSAALPAAGRSPSEDSEGRLLAELLEQALSRLPLEQREAFVLRHVEGFSYEEMAELTEASVSAMKMRVHRAREALREFLNDALEMG